MTVRALTLGVDAGQTLTKAALFDGDGVEVAVARVPSPVTLAHPGWVERDMDEVWDQVATAVRGVLAQVGTGAVVTGVGLCGHGDGLYAVDAAGRPVRAAILATDSRGRPASTRLGADERGRESLRLTGQRPSPASPASLLTWLREHEPAAYARTRWVLSCKDWLRLRLVGEVATDPSDASAAFTDLRTQAWSPAALALFDLPEVARMLPPIRPSTAGAGAVTASAARRTGLAQGTPVVVGAHDVDAAAIGIGAARPGAASVVLGTYSINQVLADHPVTDPRWQARAFVRPGQWLHMATSVAGAANLDWAARRIGPWGGDGEPDPAAAVREASGADAGDAPLFLPFLHGPAHGADVGAAWLGVRARHDRGDLLAAVLEGVAFTHRTHLGHLREAFTLDRPVRVCGGGARSAVWTQLLSDVLDLPVEVTDATEAGARGAAMLAAVGTGGCADLDEADRRWVRTVRRHEPDPVAVRRHEARYRRHLAAVDALGVLEQAGREPT